MAAITNVEELRQYKRRFSLTVEQGVTFASSPSMVRGVSKFQTNRVTLFYVIEYSHLVTQIHFIAKL